MKNLFENWRGFLNESLLLKPGPDGWEKYSELVGKAYLAAPKFEERAVPHFQAMIPFIEKMFKRISSRNILLVNTLLLFVDTLSQSLMGLLLETQKILR